MFPTFVSGTKRNSFMRQIYTEKSMVVTCSLVEQGKGAVLNKTIVFDTETTGLSAVTDEILQLSIIDGDGKVLFSSLVKPYFHDSWEQAQSIHGISPEDVENAPYAHEIVKGVKKIFDSADELITYNGMFDMRMLERWSIDIDLEKKIHHDVMKYFAKIYGERNEQYGNYKWQKLEKCAQYYGYEYKAHDALEDVKATLYCWNKIKETFGNQEGG